MQGLGGAPEQASAHRIQGATLIQQFAPKLCVAHLLALLLAINDLSYVFAPVGRTFALCRLL